jgi:hypothetical protein
MAVRAADVTFLDLGRHDRPRLAKHQQRNVLTFRRAVPVIELERDDVALTTIDTRMRTQVSTEKTPVLRPPAASSVDLASDVVGPIAEVMRFPICRMTRAAVGLSRAERLTTEGKRGEWLEEVAPDAAAKNLVGFGDLYGRDRHRNL